MDPRVKLTSGHSWLCFDLHAQMVMIKWSSRTFLTFETSEASKVKCCVASVHITSVAYAWTLFSLLSYRFFSLRFCTYARPSVALRLWSL